MIKACEDQNVFLQQVAPSSLDRVVGELFGSSTSRAPLRASDQPRELRSQTLNLNLHGIQVAITLHTFTHLHMLDEIQGFIAHERAGGAEALSRMLALTLELRLADNNYEFPLQLHSGFVGGLGTATRRS